MTVQTNLRDLSERWAKADAGERANAQLYLSELTDALDVTRPQPRGSGYEFELPIQVVNRDGSETTQFADLYKRDCFLLEAKDYQEGRSDDVLLRRAYGQVRGYAAHVPGALPPYLMVLDVGRQLLIWDRWSGAYGGFKAARRVDLTRLHERPEEISLLQAIWEDPQSLDPQGPANVVTKEIAGHLAELATRLEGRGHDQEKVARFLIRCVFTMFAEDVGLLKGEPFLRAVRDFGLEDPPEFSRAVKDLWEAMDKGSRFGLDQLLEFDGHFFHDQEVIPLENADLAVLLEAAEADWSAVEPSIMGTLLVRALDPKERHRLGAQFTPRQYVERLVRPTIEEPIRERWTLVEAEVLQLRERGRKKDVKEALKRLREFHDWLRDLRILDPACGSGNFLYVAMETIKRIELEVLHTIEEITGHPELAVEEVGPWQFLGIEVKAWSREIAELTLWIGYHQFWMAHHGHTMPPEPVLRDSGNLELRDAVLAWDDVVVDPERSRADPTPRVRHPVTGDLVPDPEARLSYVEYKGARQAEWPEADFIVGNPPYMGRGRQREAFGDGYIDALREAYPEVPDNADYVMHWWHRAAKEVAGGHTRRAGLITTNSIRHQHNREIVSDWADAAPVIWAIPDHPWVDETGAADVRVSMTVIGDSESTEAVLMTVNRHGAFKSEQRVQRLNADLTAHADIARAVSERLIANDGISSQGFTLVGRGFVLDSEEGKALRQSSGDHETLVRPYLTGRDLTQTKREQYVIDFGLMTEAEARGFPVLFDIVRARVKPQRDGQRRASRKKYWWRFGEPTISLREAVEELDRYIGTTETAKHRVFRFLPTEVATSHKIICIALENYFHLGVLSSAIHVTWSDAAGGRLGVGNDPVYTKSNCFDPFPFPDPESELRERVAEVASRLHAHREDALDRDESVTITGMYNVVEKLRSSEELTEAEREIHQIAACGVLRDLHDELDAAVAEAYGWPWPLKREEILDRLVRLHDERVAEEKAGKVRWLRPEYQIPKFGQDIEEEEMSLGLEDEDEIEDKGPISWPQSTVDQIAALKAAVAERSGTTGEILARFEDAPKKLVERHLETLEIVGELRRDGEGRYQAPVSAGETV